jgi:hypothetical protein
MSETFRRARCPFTSETVAMMQPIRLSQPILVSVKGSEDGSTSSVYY